MRVLFLVFLGAVVVHANEHILTYVGYDHLLDYNPTTGNIRAFDFRRNLLANDSCDFFVFPPLIETSKFIDVVTITMAPSAVQMVYMGLEMFLVHDSSSGNFLIRRCSGFMPQQTLLPCEVYVAGHDKGFLAPNRFFYAGPNRMIRYNSATKAFDLLWYDTDVHGGGFPFGDKPLLSGQFGGFSDEAIVNFAIVQLAQPPMDLLLAQDENAGLFKIWKYNSTAKTIEDLVGQQVLIGTLLPHYQIKPLGENFLLASYHVTGDFEIWRLDVNGDRVQLSVVKSDSLENGHGCIFDNRQSCIGSAQCGWCADSVTCHQMNSHRQPCDGTVCLSVIDQTSPDKQKNQQFEMPIPSAMRTFGEQPANNPTSPLRGLHNNSAVPITRSGDLNNESILDGLVTNPSEGVVYVPPKSDNVPCMDDLWQDPRALPPPNVNASALTMNAYDGAFVAPQELSPLGAAKWQQVDSDCTDSAVRRNTSAALTTRDVSGIPSGVPGSSDLLFRPSYDGFAIEDDLMNGVRSTYSSLMPKDNNIEAERFDTLHPPAPLTTDMIDEMLFRPKDTSKLPYVPALQPFQIPEPVVNTPSQMEEGIGSSVGDACNTNLGGATETSAMTNAQYLTGSMVNPPLVPAARLSMEHSSDKTGSDSARILSLGVRQDEAIVEGTVIPDVPVIVSEMTLGTFPGVPAPEAEITTPELRAAADEATRVVLEQALKTAEHTAAAEGIDIAVDVPIGLMPVKLPEAVLQTMTPAQKADYINPPDLPLPPSPANIPLSASGPKVVSAYQPPVAVQSVQVVNVVVANSSTPTPTASVSSTSSTSISASSVPSLSMSPVPSPSSTASSSFTSTASASLSVSSVPSASAAWKPNNFAGMVTPPPPLPPQPGTGAASIPKADLNGPQLQGTAPIIPGSKKTPL